MGLLIKYILLSIYTFELEDVDQKTRASQFLYFLFFLHLDNWTNGKVSVFHFEPKGLEMCLVTKYVVQYIIY